MWIQKILEIMTMMERIIASNRERKRIESLLKENGMYLCQDGIFKGEYPFTKYVGKMMNYKEILQGNKQIS